MSFFPRDEYVPRRGVAMKVVEPNPNLRTGAPRDAKVEAEAKKFEAQEFVLSKAMTDKAPKNSKVKTFMASDIPWAVGNGNVIAPPKPEPKQFRRIIGHRVPDELMSKYYHSEHVERERQMEAERMTHAKNFADNFSPQPPERRHKILPRLIENRPQAQAVVDRQPINGFRGLGSVNRVRPAGKGHVPETTYDPLGMRRWSPRVTGLKRHPHSDSVSLAEEALRHDDGIPFNPRADPKKPVHRHEFPQRFGAEHDVDGFSGLGRSDQPQRVAGRMHSTLTHGDHHIGGAQRDPSGYGTQHQASSPSQAAAPPHQYRSASSLGMASPSHSYGGMAASSPSLRGGRESAPPGLGASVRFHAQTN